MSSYLISDAGDRVGHVVAGETTSREEHITQVAAQRLAGRSVLSKDKGRQTHIFYRSGPATVYHVRCEGRSNREEVPVGEGDSLG